MNFRHIKMMVADMQMAILEKGKELSKKISAIYDNKIASARRFKRSRDELKVKLLTEIDRINLPDEDEIVQNIRENDCIGRTERVRHMIV